MKSTNTNTNTNNRKLYSISKAPTPTNEEKARAARIADMMQTTIKRGKEKCHLFDLDPDMDGMTFWTANKSSESITQFLTIMIVHATKRKITYTGRYQYYREAAENMTDLVAETYNNYGKAYDDIVAYNIKHANEKEKQKPTCYKYTAALAASRAIETVLVTENRHANALRVKIAEDGNAYYCIDNGENNEGHQLTATIPGPEEETARKMFIESSIRRATIESAKQARTKSTAEEDARIIADMMRQGFTSHEIYKAVRMKRNRLIYIMNGPKRDMQEFITNQNAFWTSQTK